jgi:hypothetical protein
MLHACSSLIVEILFVAFYLNFYQNFAINIRREKTF